LSYKGPVDPISAKKNPILPLTRGNMVTTEITMRKGAYKSLTFGIFLFAAQRKEFFLDGLKKLVQRSHKRVELRGGICRVNTFLQFP
jgi:hypothetical protein